MDIPLINLSNLINCILLYLVEDYSTKTKFPGLCICRSRPYALYIRSEICTQKGPAKQWTSKLSKFSKINSVLKSI